MKENFKFLISIIMKPAVDYCEKVLFKDRKNCNFKTHMQYYVLITRCDVNISLYILAS